jgi:2-keto-3-deoxy-L-rhamnonate aldolase RhmA
MLKVNQTIHKLRRGETVYGTSIAEFPLPGTVTILQRAGFDFVHVCCEHTSIELTQVSEMVRAARAEGIDCLVRVTGAVPHLIVRMLDIGVDGIVVPHVDSRAEAETVVETAKFPPLGHRGVGYGGLNVGYQMQVDVEQFIAHANDNLMIVAMIESRQAVENLEQIVSVPGIDATLIGPADLSTSYGLPGRWEEPAVEEAIQRVVDLSAQHGVAPGIHLTTPQAVRRWRDRGMRFLMCSSDRAMLARAAMAEVGSLRA